MSGLIIPVGYGRVIHSLKWLNDPEPMAVTYGIEVVSGGGFTVNGLAQECHEAFALVMAEVSVEIDLVQTEVGFRSSAAPAPLDIGVYASTVHGAAAGTVVPQNTAYLVHKRTAVGGRGGRGRMFLPGVGESVVDNTGNVSSGKVTGINTALSNFLTELEDGPTVAGMALLHDADGAYSAESPHAVTSLLCDPIVATQRRRLRK